jgi:catechol 2,3-dioxygenase-like lactoylglutathione lyase family enzyme
MDPITTRPFFPSRRLGYVTLVVPDYDEAIHFYVDVLGFDLVEDTPISSTKRWVLVAPAGADQTCLLLARAVTPEQASRIGDQTGGRVFLFLHTTAFDQDYARLRDAGVVFQEEPRQEPYGKVAVFKDLYGNLWDLLQPA